MGRNEEQHNLYIPKKDWKLLLEAKLRSGVSVSKQLITAYRYWIKHNPKDLQDLAEEFERISEVRQAKEEERKSGDYLGSFDKMEEKIERIKEKVKKGKITEEAGEILIRQTKDRYKLTQKAYEDDILKEKEPEKRKFKSKEEKLRWYREQMGRKPKKTKPEKLEEEDEEDRKERERLTRKRERIRRKRAEKERRRTEMKKKRCPVRKDCSEECSTCKNLSGYKSETETEVSDAIEERLLAGRSLGVLSEEEKKRGYKKLDKKLGDCYSLARKKRIPLMEAYEELM